ncbi:MAG TPA: enoyl-CoA hydratase-related protein [Myxococcota bacterium]|nr:enoyl-CoA hydratase-related protein [Myxococcota bacterium]
MSDEILTEVVDPVATIRLNRPDKLNALTYSMLRALRAAVDEAAADARVVGIVITGAGRGFCAGLDASVLASTSAAGSASKPAEVAGELPGLVSYLLRVPKPVIAAVNGPAAGGGLVLAALCDVRFASTDASFTTVFSKRGLVAEHGTSWILPRLLGAGRALELLWSSRRVGAEEALRIGLVEFLTPPEELVARAQQFVRELAASASPASLRETKRLVYDHLGLGFEPALRDADAAQWRQLDHPDALEGATSYLEKRAPRFARVGVKEPR